MTDSLSQQFLIIQWVIFNSFINQIHGTKSLNFIQYSSMVSQKSLSRETSPKGSKMPYSSQDPLQKIPRPLVLSLNGSKLAWYRKRASAIRQPNCCHSSLISSMYPNPYSPKQISQSSNNRLVSAHRSQKFPSIHACVGVCLRNCYLKEEHAPTQDEYSCEQLQRGRPAASCPEASNHPHSHPLPATQSLQPPSQVLLINRQQCIYGVKTLL